MALTRKMRRSRSLESSFLAMGCVAAFFSGLYLLFPTRFFSYDGICYALDVEFGSMINLFHSNHLLYSPASRVIYQVFRMTGSSLRALAVMQGANAIAAGV